MRATAVLAFAILIGVGGVARADEVAFETPREQCPGPAGYTEIVGCLKLINELEPVARPSPHSVMFGSGRRLYVQRADGKWQMITRSLERTQQVVGEVPMTLGGRPAMRYEVRDLQSYNGRALLRVKSAIVCSAESCAVLVYACSYVEHGRATSMLAGAIVDDHGVAKVDADRSLALGACNR